MFDVIEIKSRQNQWKNILDKLQHISERRKFEMKTSGNYKRLNGLMERRCRNTNGKVKKQIILKIIFVHSTCIKHYDKN